MIRNRSALPNPVVLIMPKMLDGFPSVTRPRILDVGKPASSKRIACEINRSRIEKIRNVVRRDVEIPKAMKQVRPSPWPCSTDDVVLDLADWNC